MKGYLILENGEIFEGERFGAARNDIFEVVFNTAITGYIEILTDPSNAGQGIVMTYSLIGNYGAIAEDEESNKIWAKAIFVHELAKYESHFRLSKNLDSFLKENNVPGLTGINTRKLTRVLKKYGTMKGALVSDISNIEEIISEIKNFNIEDIVSKVTYAKAVAYGSTKPKQIAILDLGVKHNIINSLLRRGVGVNIYPADISYDQILARRPDGIVISNGPGNPEDNKYQIETIKKLYKTNIPILAIGLGHELMALATGAKIKKLKYGHRGINYSVKDLKTGLIYITAQNHGHCVEENSIDPEIAEISHINLNDGTIAGLVYKNKKIFTVQFCPEACPGPEDMSYIFDDFINIVNKGYTQPLSQINIISKSKINSLDKPQSDNDLTQKLLKSKFLEEQEVPLFCDFLVGVKNSENKSTFKNVIKKIGEPCITEDEMLEEKRFLGWKKIGYELIRDRKETCIMICNMESIDSVQSEAEDNIVVAPSQTLANKEFQMLRTSAVKILSNLKIEGECYVQFILNPYSFEYAVVDLNFGINKFSKLASEATGYPIAKVTEKIAKGYSLDEIKFDANKNYSCFEPSIDYVTLKIPKWSFNLIKNDELENEKEIIETAQNMEKALMNAVCALKENVDSLVLPSLKDLHKDELLSKLALKDSERIFAIAEALRHGISIEEICKVTLINKYFIGSIQKIVDMERELKINSLNLNLLLKAKNYGFTDKVISELNGKSENEISEMRTKYMKN